MVNIFQSSPAQIEEALHEFGVTHISATPTFYRLRLQRLNGTFPEVQRLTSGGEKFEPSLRDVLGEIFPNAEFRNVYALTEAGSLLESNDEFFRIPGDLSDRIQVTDENELVVHESLLGEVDEEKIADGWFKTGDLIEYVDDEHFRFVGRKSEFVNVGGYRVNPHEIEEFISRIDGVEAVVVSSRSSSVTGNILTAKIQTANDADDQRIKDEVQEAVSTLDSWKQPRIIRVEDELKLSRSGKRVR
jgi:acyl-CoA synthetase (AMP-forming)/AMP-acid ligase II